MKIGLRRLLLHLNFLSPLTMNLLILLRPELLCSTEHYPSKRAQSRNYHLNDKVTWPYFLTFVKKIPTKLGAFFSFSQSS